MAKERPPGSIGQKEVDSLTQGEEILGHYTTKQWIEAIDRTRLYVVKMTKQRGLERLPDEWVLDAIGKLISGKSPRSWSPEYPLPQQLIHICRSDYSHFKDKSNKHTSIDDSSSPVEELVCTNTPEKIFSLEQEIQLAVSKVNEAGNEIDKKVIEAYRTHGIEPNKNADMAALIGVEPKDVVYSKKRIQRILGKWRGII